MSTHDAETIRGMIEHENELINNRVSWLMTFQGLLFTCVGFVWDKQRVDMLIPGLCLLGIVIAVLCLFTLVGATHAMSLLYDTWTQNKPTDYSGPAVIGSPPPKSRFFRYLAPWNWFPVVTAVAWGFVWYAK
jgi:hypothetical protein